jgi:methionyl-tRNA formyltransferase
MKKTSNQIVFFGSGPVAAQALQLISEEYDIECVVTKARLGGHKHNLPVLELCQNLRLKNVLANNKDELDQIFEGSPFKSKIAILVDYGIIVSEKVISYFPFGIVNSHFSLLPEWRGADPISFAILSGQTYTGVSLMLVSKGMDEGQLLAQAKLKVGEMDSLELTDALVKLSDQLLKDNLNKYISGDIKPYDQPVNIRPTYSHKLKKEDGIIDWSKPAKQIEQEIRAYISWPKSHATLKTLDVIITKAHVLEKTGKIGDLEILDRKLIVYCGKDALAIDKLKPIGKPEMTIESFLIGYKTVIS